MYDLNKFISSSFESYMIALSPKILVSSKLPHLQIIIGLFLLENSAIDRPNILPAIRFKSILFFLYMFHLMK